ncbi:hypothetical protein PC123_g22351 [Phytophthora cactorum]|nr:hypothetical protein PC120_g6217 [Phytophthora cactorum]KAG4042152.1 hypothetical protein PC123_g22351 [Phytophthora cactorum]
MDTSSSTTQALPATVSKGSKISGSRRRARPWTRLRPVVPEAVALKCASNTSAPSRLAERLRESSRALAKVGLALPDPEFPLARETAAGPDFLHNNPLKKVLSEFVR